MKNFQHSDAFTVDQAISALGDTWTQNTRVMAGGIDLVAEMKAEIETPDHVVNLKTVGDLAFIRYDAATGLRIGALTTLTNLEDSDVIQQKYPVLAQAIAVLASPQIRNVATLAGNIMQRPRCWYYRGDFPCWKKGGTLCYAKYGENKYHAVLGGEPCYIVHPSDAAPALITLNASLKLQGPDGERIVAMDTFFTLPAQNRERRETSLKSNELITEILVPAPKPNTAGVFIKVRERGSWDFAMASAAITLTKDPSGKITDARVCLGGVAPIPWRAEKAEKELIGRKISESVALKAAKEAYGGAKALEQNAYKITLGQALVKQGVLALS